MFRTASRGAHRAAGRAVIDYRGFAAPVCRGMGGAAVIGAVVMTAALTGAASAGAQAPVAPSTASVRGIVPGAAPAIAPVVLPGVVPASQSPFIGVTLRLGARGDAVRDLQERLIAHGASLGADGVFGAATLRAVMAHQSGAGLTVDGVVGRMTWNALSGAVAAPAAPAAVTVATAAPAATSQPTLRLGSRGVAVRTLQSLLHERGASISIDGIFGRATATAVRSMQSAAGLGVDGVVGARTWSALTGPVRVGDGGTSRSETRTPTRSTSVDGPAVIAAARAQLGARYTWGGSTPATGFDCSGLVHHAYTTAGVDLPRKTAKGYTFGGRIIPRSEAQPGDLVAFTGDDYGHIGIYLGDGRIVDASGSRRQVVERSIWNAPHVFVTYR